MKLTTWSHQLTWCSRNSVLYCTGKLHCRKGSQYVFWVPTAHSLGPHEPAIKIQTNKSSTQFLIACLNQIQLYLCWIIVQLEKMKSQAERFAEIQSFVCVKRKSFNFISCIIIFTWKIHIFWYFTFIKFYLKYYEVKIAPHNLSSYIPFFKWIIAHCTFWRYRKVFKSCQFL